MSMEPMPCLKGGRYRHSIISSPARGKRVVHMGLYVCKRHEEPVVFKSPDYYPHCPECGKGGCAKVKRGMAVE